MKDLELLNAFCESVTRLGLKSTKQREAIAAVFFRHSSHVTADEMLELVRRSDPGVSLATVYRTLRLLQECGFARVHQFHDGQALYEPSFGEDEHHDHLICLTCHKIVEFVNDEIEKLQETVALQYGFKIVHHRLEIYGLCQVCERG